MLIHLIMHCGPFRTALLAILTVSPAPQDSARVLCRIPRLTVLFLWQDPLEFYGYLSPKLEALKMDPAFLNRNVNEGFSGGEKKRNEVRPPLCPHAIYRSTYHVV